MKKLVLAFASVALLATPVLACPHSDKAESDAAAPKTAEKAKEAPAKAKEAAPTKETAKTTKPAEKTTEKKPEKVSAR